jgi:hypothetical protein
MSYFLWLNLILNFHPFYVSLAEVKVNPEKERVEVSCRIFTDDLEKALKANHLGIHDLTHPKDRAETEEALAKYIPQHFFIEWGGKVQTLKMIGFEIEGDACWTYFEIPLVKGELKKVHIHDALLFEAHPEEINIVRFISGSKTLSTKLENPKSDFYPE